jgi:hypothetical protein
LIGAPTNFRWAIQTPSGTLPSSSVWTNVFPYYYQVSNTFSVAFTGGNPGTGDTLSLTGSLFGTSGATVLSLNVAGVSSASNTAWSDYNYAVTFPASTTLSGSSERWSISNAYSTAALTAGGNSYSPSINYYNQYKQTLSYQVVDGGSPSSPTATGTSSGSAYVQTLTTTATAYWFDASGSIAISTSTGATGEQWAPNPASIAATTTNTQVVSVYHQYQVSFAVTPSGSGTTSPSGTNIWENAASISISAIDNSGYYFSSWSATSGITITSSTSASTTATVGSAGTITANSQLLDHFIFSTVGSPQTAGTSFSITITAQDASGNTVAGYTGSNTLTVSSGTITPASTGSFIAGVWTGSVKLVTAGTGITISTTGGSKSGTSTSFTVSPGTLASFTITGYSTSVIAGNSFGGSNVVVTAYDAYGNVATNYVGSVYFTSTDSQAVLPYTSSSKYTFVSGDSGVHTFAGAGFTLKTVGSGTQTITVTDGTHSATSNPITVSAASFAGFTLAGYSTSVTAGTNFGSSNVVVTAIDAYGNTVTSYTGSIYFTSTDSQAVMPYTSSSVYTFTTGSGKDNGQHTFAGAGFTLKTAGSQTITVTTGSISKASTSITVSPGAAATLTVSGFPSSVTAGTAGSLTVTAKDAYGNVATGYRGTVHFTSSDIQAALPSNYVFTSGDNGAHTFTNGATLKTAGTQSITATDTGTGTITGSQTGVTVNPGAAYQLGFTVAPTSVTHNQVSSVFTVSLEDQYGNYATSGSSITINLSDNSGHGGFYSDPSGQNKYKETSVSIASGTTTASFYWEYSYWQNFGNYVITASAQGLTQGTATTTISVS